MRTLRIGIFILVALAQLSVPALMAWGRMQTLARGRVWKFKTAPIDPEDAVRYYALRLREAGMIKSGPNRIIAQGTDWRFFNELRRELKA